MSLYGAIDKTKHFSEFADPLPTQEGVLSGATRKARCLSNLGLTALAAEINTLAGVVAGTASASKAVVLGASKEIADLGNTDITGRLTTTDGVASGTARVVGGNAFVGSNAADNVTAAASNNIFVAFAQSYSIPANTIKLGTTVRIKAAVTVSDASGLDTLTVETRLGGVTLIATTAVDPTTTSDTHLLEFEFTSRAAPGAAASCVGYGRWITNTAGTIAHGTGRIAPTNFATNGALVVDVRAKWSLNTANTSARLEMVNVEII